jgi:hypothetical protein
LAWFKIEGPPERSAISDLEIKAVFGGRRAEIYFGYHWGNFGQRGINEDRADRT